MPSVMSLVITALAATSAQGVGVATSAQVARANPIRRVVTMLQKIQAKVEEEGEKETELHEKYMCACKTGSANFAQSIADGEAKVENLAASLEAAAGQQAQLKSDLTNHKADRAAAKQALADATSMREKEASAFAGVKAEAEANIAAMNKAVAAIEKGAGGAFLQTDAAQKLRDLANSNQEMLGDTRETVMAFLSNEEESEGSGEITGVLKQLGKRMGEDLAEATAAEEKAIANFNELTAAKNGEVASLNTAIEDKISRVGESGLAIEDMKADAKDTADKLADDKQALADLKKDCAKKEEEWAAISKERQQELVALADTITMLNSDDALELFKKALPSAAASFMQIKVSAAATRARALAVIHSAQRHGRPSRHIDFISLALHGKTSGDFTKVIGMIDEMVKVLKSEQNDDNDKKEYCNAEIDGAEDAIKVHKQTVKDSEAAIADAKETAANLDQEIKAMAQSLTDLDASVKAATAQRKKENEAWKVLQSQNAAAKGLIEMAKTRLNKFYNPALALVSRPTSFLQVRRAAPESLAQFQKKAEESNAVIAMMDTLVADLDKETQIAEADEKDAQADYEKFMADSKSMRSDSGKILEDKTAAKADAEGALQTHEDDLEVNMKKQKGSEDQLRALHQDCDWLLENYDSRKQAREDEIDSLGKAKAVLSGADA